MAMGVEIGGRNGYGSVSPSCPSLYPKDALTKEGLNVLVMY